MLAEKIKRVRGASWWSERPEGPGSVCTMLAVKNHILVYKMSTIASDIWEHEYLGDNTSPLTPEEHWT